MAARGIGLERHRGPRVTEGVVHLRQPSPDANHPIRATNSPLPPDPDRHQHSAIPHVAREPDCALTVMVELALPPGPAVMMVCCLALAEEFISITVAILASTAANCSLSWLILATLPPSDRTRVRIKQAPARPFRWPAWQRSLGTRIA